MAYFMVLFQLLLQELKKSMISLSQNWESTGNDLIPEPSECNIADLINA
jgi:hypothetical protein